MSRGPEIVRTQLEVQKRQDAINDAVEALVHDYHSRLGRGALTVVSALIATIGFLINSHHIVYISKPISIKVCLYSSLAIFAAVFFLEMVNARTTAIYAYKRINESQHGQHIWRNIVKTVRISIEVLCVTGIIFLVRFSWLLLHNVIG
jgi:hypothetical protein